MIPQGMALVPMSVLKQLHKSTPVGARTAGVETAIGRGAVGKETAECFGSMVEAFQEKLNVVEILGAA